MEVLGHVAGHTAHVVQAVLVLEQPGVGLHKRLGEAAVQPFPHGGGAELAALFKHHLQGVGKLELAAGADVVIHEVLEGRPEGFYVLDVVDAHDGFVGHEFLGLFHQALDVAGGVGDGHAETAGVGNLVGVEDVGGGVGQCGEVGVEEGVAQDDEQGLVVLHVGERKADGLPEALGVALEHGAGLAPLGSGFQELAHLFGLVAGNEDGLGRFELQGVFHDPVDDGLAAHGEQALRQIVGVGAHAFALPCYRQNNLHLSNPSLHLKNYGTVQEKNCAFRYKIIKL